MSANVLERAFVPNISMGMPAVKALRPVSKAFFDVHLMIVQPERYVEEFVKAGAEAEMEWNGVSKEWTENRTAALTSAAPLHRAMAAGLRSIIAFQILRHAS